MELGQYYWDSLFFPEALAACRLSCRRLACVENEWIKSFEGVSRAADRCEGCQKAANAVMDLMAAHGVTREVFDKKANTTILQYLPPHALDAYRARLDIITGNPYLLLVLRPAIPSIYETRDTSNFVVQRNKSEDAMASEDAHQVCSICMSESDELVALMMCGHRCCCRKCADALMCGTKQCPICRQSITGSMRIYES